MTDLDKITYAYIETTNYCNLDCSFCNRLDVIGPLKHMSIDKYKNLLDKIKDQPISEAKLMGMGEPFLHPKFAEICKLFKEYFPKAFLIVATNCQYKIRPTMEESMKYIDLLYFSIDGYKESYEKYRPPSKWYKLINFLDDFKNLKRSKCRVTINYVVNPGNIQDISKVHDNILIPYNLSELRLNIAQEWSEDKSMMGGYSQNDINYLKQNWRDNIKGKSEWDYNDCFWPKKGLYTTVEGRILMCPLNTGTEDFGNIFLEDLDVIRNNTKYSEVRSGCQQNMPSKHCTNCSYKELSPLLKEIGVVN